MSSELIKTTIESLSHDGRGIATLQGKTTFVDLALPTEEVLCKITHKHRRYNEAQTIEVLSGAKERVTPACAHFGICGGCSMQHIEIDAQIKFKQQTLLDQLKHFGNVTAQEILPPLMSGQFGYRRKARLGVRYVFKKEKLLVGFREKLSRYLADIEQCLILHPHIGLRITELSQLIRGLSQFDQIPQVEVAVSDNATALIFRHMTALSETDMHALCEFGQKYDMHIYLQPNSPAPVHKIWPNDQNERLSYILSDYQLEMRFHPQDFTQVNSEMNQMMIKQALNLLDPKTDESILDLFCGLGNFTLPIARFAKNVIGVEGSAQMVERARENAQHNQINNAEFYVANLMEPANTANWLKKPFDKILLDPPRTGAKEIMPFLDAHSPKRIVYVSCNPATLARDAGILVHQYHYTLKKIGVMNMFPHTSHIEAIALFEK